MSEIQRGQIRPVEDEHNLGNPKMRSHPEHDECKLKEIVDNEMGAYVGGRCYVLGVAREEVV